MPATGRSGQVHAFDPTLYNPALPVAENLLFATPCQPITAETLAGQTEFLAQLRGVGLDETLLHLTRDVLEMLRQAFGVDGTDHPLFRRLGLGADSYETALTLVDRAREGGAASLSIRTWRMCCWCLSRFRPTRSARPSPKR